MLMYEEINRKYSNSHALIYLKNTKEYRVVKFNHIYRSDKGDWYAVVLEVDGDDFSIKERKTLAFPIDEKQYKLSDITIIPPPNKQCFDWLGRTIVFSKFPNRQWHKGLTQNNSSFNDRVLEIVQSVRPPKEYKYRTSPNFRLSLESIFCMFRPNFAGSFTQALADIESHKLLSRTINSEYYVSSFPSLEKPFLLFRYEFPLAYYNPETRLFTLTQELYRQEVLDFCNRQGILYEIN